MQIMNLVNLFKNFIWSFSSVNSLPDACIFVDKTGLIRSSNRRAKDLLGFDAGDEFKKVDDGKFEIVNIIQEHKRSDLPLFICRNDINNNLFEVSINKPHDVQREILTNKDEYIGKYMVVEFRNRSGVTQVPFHARGIDIKYK